jgi:hypothetical protein
MVPARIKQAITRSGSVENRLGGKAYTTFGWILIILTNRIILSLQRPLPLYSISTKMRLYTISIY